jgi:hypothetical protein
MNKFIMIILFVLFAFLAQIANAAVYHVDNVNDGAGDTGTEAAPFDTIAACTAAMSASGDDTCFIHAGNYAETINVKSGTEGHKNTYAAWQNGTVVVTGVATTATKHDFRLIGLTFKGGSSYTMLVNNVDRADILYCTFHNTYSVPIYNNATGGGTRYLTLRGNTITMPGCLESQTETCVGSHGIDLHGDHVLIEYNTIYRPGGDYINTWLNSSIVRNNYMHDFSFSYFPGNAGTAHPDIVQIYGDGSTIYETYNLFIESNYVRDIDDADGHFIQLKRTTTTTEADTGWRDLTIRGNLGKSVGSYFHELSGIDSARVYNNTLVDFVNTSTIGYNAISSAFYFNNLFYETDSTPINPYATRTTYGTSSITASNNACVIGSTHASCAVTTDPLLTNYAGGVFTIQSGSPAKNAGKYITLADGASVGEDDVTLVVDDAEYFTDGFGLTGGDIIKIGANNPVTISAINYDTKTITISTAQTWADNAEIYWRNQDTQPDIGAWEYKASHTLTGTWALSEGTVTVTPNDATLVRFVEVSENGVPVGTDYSSPYTVAGVGAGLVTVRIFSLHASTTPIVMATQGGDETAPTLAEVTPVSTPSPNTTPVYVFSSDEAGSITYGGTCGNGSLSNAINGNNTVSWTLPIGTYSNCTITVNDGTNASTPLAVTEFVISGTPVYTLTVNKTGDGCTVVSSPDTSISCGATCSASMGAGTEVQLFGLSNSGWEPVVFGQDASAGGTVTMDAAKTVTATCAKTVIWP